MTSVVNGYVIVGPNGNILSHTFSETPASAWARHVGIQSRPIDHATLIQRWFDKGYRIKTAKLTLEEPN